MTAERWQQVETLYHATLGREPGERVAFLAVACQGDEELRREVESLLAQDASGSHLLDNPAWEGAASLLGTPAGGTPAGVNVSAASNNSDRPSGQIISHYEILDKLGGGGMGVVYRARDLKLDRSVALKFLSHEISAEEDYKQRFVREAKAASALDHPNICTIHEVDETADGQMFIAMAYYRGETLKEKIKRGPLTLVESIGLAIQVAQGLAKAHQRGIAHRDIKPANVLVTEEGVAKIVDFGLAQLGDATKLTKTGSTLGTPAYMSPEQAQRLPGDHRSDIWSLGVLLYEMVTGRTPFEGKHEAVLLAIMHEEHEPITAVRAGVPLELDRIVAKALAKNPAERYQHINDLLVDLRAMTVQRDSGRFAASYASQKPGTRLLPWTAVSAALLATAGLTWWLTRFGEHAPVASPQLKLTQLTSDTGLTFEPSISTDGTLVAYASDRAGDGGLDIWVQQASGGGAVRLTDHEADDRSPTFSPDGGRIAFRSERDGGGIYVVPTLGGDARLIAERGLHPRFSPDGKLVAYHTGEPALSSLFVVPAEGGAATRLAADREEAHQPMWLPDGKHLLFIGRDLPHGAEWFVASVTEGPIINTGVVAGLAEVGLTPGGLNRLFTPEAWHAEANAVVFSARSGGSTNLWRIPISPETWKVAGSPQRLTFGTGTEGQASMASGGRVAFSGLLRNQDVWALPIDPNEAAARGEIERLTTSPASDEGPSVSSDGRKLVFRSNRSGDWSIWFKDLDTDKETALTTANPKHGRDPVISPDGSKVVYRLGAGPEASMFVVATNQHTPQTLCEGCGGRARSWSSDGSMILHQRQYERTIHLRDVTTGEQTEILRGSQRAPTSAHFSFDDRWITFIAAPSFPLPPRLRRRIVPE